METPTLTPTPTPIPIMRLSFQLPADAHPAETLYRQPSGGTYPKQVIDRSLCYASAFALFVLHCRCYCCGCCYCCCMPHSTELWALHTCKINSESSPRPSHRVRMQKLQNIQINSLARKLISIFYYFRINFLMLHLKFMLVKLQSVKNVAIGWQWMPNTLPKYSNIFIYYFQKSFIKPIYPFQLT